MRSMFFTKDNLNVTFFGTVKEFGHYMLETGFVQIL